MTVPLGRRRARTYDPSKNWKQKSLYVPVGLAARLKDAARAAGKAEKQVIIEALEAKLPVPGAAKSSKDPADE